MTQYVGNNPTDVLDGFIKRYFYGLRRNDDGELFLVRLDQLAPGTDPITLNELGEADGNFPDFEEGIDYLDGLDENHNILYANLRYPQLKWDGRSLLYYVDQTDGQFVLRISEGYTYPTGNSSDGTSSTYGGLAGSGY
tara:strand:+ start:113 stop:526 length:414 start_codon:yes stop_codon:yes gene_type:complete